MKHHARRERDNEQLRSKIMDAARTLFVTEGYAHVSMRKIADRIEYSPTTIYHYFANKEAIVQELLREVYSQFFTVLTKQANELEENGYDIPARLFLVSKTYVEYGITHPDHYDIMFISNLEAVSNAELDVNDRLNGYTFLHEAVQIAIDQNYIIHAEADMIVRSLWAMLHGLTTTLSSFAENIGQEEQQSAQTTQKDIPSKKDNSISPYKQQIVDFTLRHYMNSILKPGTALPDSDPDL
ncbi:TetR/AcrR family transcriptional regulator [Paenibacillus kyungheensis]